MEPVPAVRRVRRTVRTAVLLLLSQALLCAVIGVVTMRDNDRARAADSMAAGRLGTPAALDPSPPPARAGLSPSPAGTSSPADGARPTRHGPATGATGAADPTVTSSWPLRLPGPAATTPAGSPAATDPVPPAPPASPPASSFPSRTAPAPTPTPAPAQVRVGDPCPVAGAYARTSWGIVVICAATKRWGLRWKIA